MNDNRFQAGFAAHRQGRLADAETIYKAILTADPRHFDAINMLGALALQTNRPALAVELLSKAIKINPDTAIAHGNLGYALFATGDRSAALQSLDRAVALDARYVEGWSNRGNILRGLGRNLDALASYDKAIALQPGHATALMNRGNALKGLNRLPEALSSYDLALAVRPDFADAHWNRSLALLAMGRLHEGWRAYEWRKRRGPGATVRPYPRPEWPGTRDIVGKTVFLYWEQGLGDTIHFCRYAPLVRALGARVILSVQDSLVPLLRGLDPDVEIIGGHQTPANFDYHCPLLSLPLLFGTTLDTIPAQPRYLHTDEGPRVRWRSRLSALPGLKIGLAWASGPRPDHSAAADARSTTLNALAPLMGASFVSLQKGPEAVQAKSPPEGMRLHDWTDDLTDFAETAALIQELDLVISVDTSVAHLAGALGKPVWVLTCFDPCWRWLRDRTDNPWYPAARLFRQPVSGDWAAVVEDVRRALSRFPA